MRGRPKKPTGRPRRKPSAPAPIPPDRWLAPEWGKKLDKVLADTEAPPIDAAVRGMLLRMIYRRDTYDGGGGSGHVRLLIRTITESEGNEGALIEPIVSAVSSCMRSRWTRRGLAWVEAFDQIPLLKILETMRSLGLFREESLAHYLSMIIHNRLLKILDAPKPIKVKPEPKPPRSVTRIPEIERKIEMGRKLIELRSRHVWNNNFGRDRLKLFPDLDTLEASGLMRVARMYADRPEIYRRVSWATLLELTSGGLSKAQRGRLEARISGGEDIAATEIKRTRGPGKPGAPPRKAA